MTRKDFVLLAAALAESRPALLAVNDTKLWCELQHAADCRAVADALARDNPRFDRARFLKACGVE